MIATALRAAWYPAISLLGLTGATPGDVAIPAAPGLAVAVARAWAAAQRRAVARTGARRR